MSERRLAAVSLAAVPGLVGALRGDTSLVGLLVAVVLVAVAVVLVARGGLEPPPPGAGRWIDIAAWWAGAGSLLASVLLSSPTPSFLASATTGRRAVLALAALVAATSVALVTRRGSRPAA